MTVPTRQISWMQTMQKRINFFQAAPAGLAAEPQQYVNSPKQQINQKS
jgi:hypothetical protein